MILKNVIIKIKLKFCEFSKHLALIMLFNYLFVLTKQAFFPAQKVLKVSGIIPAPSEIQSDSSKINKGVFLQLFCGNQAKADMLQN